MEMTPVPNLGYFAVAGVLLLASFCLHHKVVSSVTFVTSWLTFKYAASGCFVQIQGLFFSGIDNK